MKKLTVLLLCLSLLICLASCTGPTADGTEQSSTPPSGTTPAATASPAETTAAANGDIELPRITF